MKTVLVTPAFCKSALLSDFLEHVYKTPPGVPHYVLINHYPVERERNNDEIRRLSELYGCIVIDSGRDLGLHESLNNAVNVIGLGDGDILSGCDADDRPSPGFVQAQERVMRADPSLAALALNFSVIDERINEGRLVKETTADEAVWIHPTVEMFTATAFNMSFVRSIGGFKQPHAYYGGIESYLYSRWKIRGLRLGYLENYRADAASVDRDDATRFDKSYREWKTAHVGGYKGGFEQWLKEFAPQRLA